MATAGKSASRSKKKQKRVDSVGDMHVYASFNNIIVTVTDTHGNKVAGCSAGEKSFRGAKKSTPFAAQEVAEAALDKAINLGMKSLRKIKVKGAGSHREAAIRAVSGKMKVESGIIDLTGVPHNGCRPKKKRRV